LQQEYCVMPDETEQSQSSAELADSLAEGIAAVMAAGQELDESSDLADLFLEELNRLWAEGPAEVAA
jgi:hypothetical protein